MNEFGSVHGSQNITWPSHGPHGHYMDLGHANVTACAWTCDESCSHRLLKSSKGAFNFMGLTRYRAGRLPARIRSVHCTSLPAGL